MQADDVAAVVVTTMKAALAPALERLAVLEAKAAELGVTLEATAAIRERLAVLETRPPLAGPPGTDGAPGKDGAPGPQGPPGLEYKDVYAAGITYTPGQVVTYAGSLWHCNSTTGARPGDGSPGWTLMVKRGRDARGAP